MTRMGGVEGEGASSGQQAAPSTRRCSSQSRAYLRRYDFAAYVPQTPAESATPARGLSKGTQ